ncbi:MAG: hypothetical protein M3R06_05020 [Chloroflexota bacterium]|nr:hypothetical protein [Chloroflexota bacterium]
MSKEYRDPPVTEAVLARTRSHPDTSSSSTAQASSLEIDVVSGIYVFRDSTDVVRFLREHPRVISPLIQADDHIRAYFGASTAVKLDVVRDPESDGYNELYAFIQTTLAVDEALERLRRFDDGWWLGALPQAEGLLTFSLEYL